MKVISTRFNVFYPDALNIREKIFILEKELSKYFPAPFTLIPLPETAPPEFPRISATSHHGYSNLSVSVNNTQLITNYDDNFNGDWGKCYSYFHERITNVYTKLCSVLNINKLLFCGLTTELAFDIDKDPVEAIVNNYLKSRPKADLLDVDFKLTFKFDDIHYLNIKISNKRVLKGTPKKINSLVGLTEDSKSISFIIDVNDRLAYNFKEDYFSDLNQIDSIVKITDEYINNKVKNIINNGEL